MQQTVQRTGRIYGLDGLRALAVVGVVAYHLWPTAVPGGFVGVDVFFVLSGYLITRSLRRGPGQRITARLGRFWQHRARRILPPLISVVFTTAAVAGIVGGNVLPGLGTAVLGALTFSSNWVAVIDASSYFAGTSVHPLQHLWSLAVEEQFYLAWPVLLLPIGVLAPRTRRWVPISIAAVSAIAMAVSYIPGTDPTAVYVGTGTHLFGLTLGAALALDEERIGHFPTATRARRVRAAAAGALALIVLFVTAFTLNDTSAITYRGGLVGVAAATVVLIASLTRGVPGIGRLLDLLPLAALGRRSYAVYLWHWPILLLLTAVVAPRTVVEHTTVWATTLLLTLMAAIVSWRYLERPVLAAGWRATIRHIAAQRTAVRVASVLAAAALTLGTGAACLASTRPSDTEQLITAGEQYLHDHSASPTAAPPPSALASSGPCAPVQPSTAPAVTPTPESPQFRTPGTPSTPNSIISTPITAVGDSVMLAAAPTLQSTVPNITINAAVSRQPYQVAPILRAEADAGTLAGTVVVGIGTNGALGDTLPAIRRAIGSNRTLVLVTAHADRPWIPGVNQTITSYAAAHPNTRVAQWNLAITGHDNLLASDGIHPGTAGARIYVQAILDALQ